MASLTKKTRIRRRLRRSNMGKKRKKMMSRNSTPPFPIHLPKDE
ncbi:MAG: hypothetical protein NZ583_02500 [Desulfobacterota bacterium]|nr:hypothetical protein [Thermodesulfobacteriota bacterium]MDW8001755.1 hypothetical protein [Deltaproteobacteria bacterium]